MTTGVNTSPDGLHYIDLSHVPLAEGWSRYTYSPKYGGLSTRWIMHKDVLGFKTFRCLECGFETHVSLGLSGHNRSH